MGNKMCCEEVQENKDDKIIIETNGHQTHSIVASVTGSKIPKSKIPENQPQDHTLLVNSKRSGIQQNPQTMSQHQLNQSHLNKSTKKSILEHAAEPSLDKVVQQNLQKYNPFYNQINSYAETYKIGSNVYRGQIDQEGRPNGYGKMFYSNGSVLVGKFQKGVPQGPVHYVWRDGSFYQGNVENGQANDTIGNYTCDEYTFKGTIKNNNFEGEGTLQSIPNKYKYTGYFQNGKRKYGKLTWKQTERSSLPLSSSQVEYDVEYSYEGNFDKNEQFTGKGILQGPKGIYKGQFKNGMKNGEGIYEYKNGLKYEGTYVDNIRDGRGIIYSKSKTVSYQGEFKNGLPHGKGKAIGKDGVMYEVMWKEGVSSQVVDESYTPAKNL